MHGEQRRQSNYAEAQIEQLLEEIREVYESYIVLKYIDLMALDPDDKGSCFPDDYYKLSCDQCCKKINGTCHGKELIGYDVMHCLLSGGVGEVIMFLGNLQG